jgi:hypothetical protein
MVRWRGKGRGASTAGCMCCEQRPKPAGLRRAAGRGDCGRAWRSHSHDAKCDSVTQASPKTQSAWPWRTAAAAPRGQAGKGWRFRGRQRHGLQGPRRRGRAAARKRRDGPCHAMRARLHWRRSLAPQHQRAPSSAQRAPGLPSLFTPRPAARARQAAHRERLHRR